MVLDCCVDYHLNKTKARLLSINAYNSRLDLASKIKRLESLLVIQISSLLIKLAFDAENLYFSSVNWFKVIPKTSLPVFQCFKLNERKVTTQPFSSHFNIHYHTFHQISLGK